MNTKMFSGKWRIFLVGVAAALSLPAAALAQQHGGGSHGASAFHGAAGFHGGPGFHGNPGLHAAPGFHGSPAFHGGFYGRPGFYPRPYYGRGYYYGPRGWYGGFALGTFVTTLPYYSTYWWGGVPYYYYDDTYFRYNDAVRQYQVVAPPGNTSDASSTAPEQPASTDLFAYPKTGQSAEQQKTDRYECHSWAVGQSGFDPTAGTADSAKRSDYQRAEAACLTGRGYSVK
ncbi:MAG TPA: hypothetical protein VGN07_01070 [Steroidobacteraceae bacterium]|jgi:hypothetical protein